MSRFVGREAPDFTAQAVMPNGDLNNDFELRKYLNGSAAFLFFYAQDFFYLCPVEIMAVQNRLAAFQARKIKPIGISVDSHLTHSKLRELPIVSGGVGAIGFPLVADISKVVSKGYDMLINDTVSLRGSFLIDEDFVVRHAATYDLPVGRNVDEVLRVFDAMAHYRTTGELCPPGWLAGERGVPANSNGLAEYMAQFKDVV